VGNAGSAHAIFERSIKARDIAGAEFAARELKHLTLVDALEMTLLIAEKDRRRYPRAARRWLERFVVETQAPIEVVQLAAAALATPELGASQLRALTEPPGVQPPRYVTIALRPGDPG
jgi:hypothetical protein